nr:hypothetical protein BaRGS_023346 [Batillaria attramentaria]
MSVRRSKDGARKRDPGGGGEVKPRHPTPPDSIPSGPVPPPRTEKILKGSKPVTPVTPGTPILPGQNIIYSTRMPNSGSVARTHAGRVLTRTDTGVSIPPNFFLDDAVGSPRSQSVTVLPGVSAVSRTATGTPVSPRVVEVVDDRQASGVAAAGSGGSGAGDSADSRNGYPGGVDAEFNTPRKWATGIAGDDERILLNVGGVRHETHVSTLRAIPNSRLSRLAEMHVQSGGGPQEYFFDRHPSVFNAIIDFYRTAPLSTL